ncbi:MAG: hypothetical protein MUF15_04705 [Acidobacteria bacterium]|jgi:hypothetical protein|nr:hypothetical protein [Acidobacteriota bacterium]
MKNEPGKKIKIIAVIEILIAIGIIFFWVTFFIKNSVSISDPKLKEIYLAFESAFPIPDAWLVITLVIGAIGLLKQAYYGYLFSLMGGASLIYLGLLDASFNTLHGIYKLGMEEAVVNLSINLLCLAGGAFIIGIAWKSGFKRGKKEAVS